MKLRTVLLLMMFIVLNSFMYATPIVNESQILCAPNGIMGDKYGVSVSNSGNFAVLGASGHNSARGAAYIYHYNGSVWVEQQIVTASDGENADYFGRNVSISGNYMIIGADGDDDIDDSSGAAYIFCYDGSNWVEQQKLTASDGAHYDMFGYRVSISGNYAIVGAYMDDDNGNSSGSAYIYHFDGTSWVEQQKLTASDGNVGDYFGKSVAISGLYAIVGADYGVNNESRSGTAYIYFFDGTNWIEQQRLSPSNSSSGCVYGRHVAIDSNIAAVGAMHDDEEGSHSGSVYFYHFDGTSWIEKPKVIAADCAGISLFGSSISISGNNAVIGACGNNNGTAYSGSAYIFYYNGTNWIEQTKLVSSDNVEDQMFGFSVSTDGNDTFVGAGFRYGCSMTTENAYIFQDELVSDFDKDIDQVSIRLKVYPNPFNPETNIDYSVKEETPVEITIYNMKGQKVKTLVDKSVSAGDHKVVWHGDSDSESSVSSGVYFVKMITGNHIETRKIVLMK